MAVKNWHPHTTAAIESVVITWRGKNGTRREMKVDTNTAHGILWKFDTDHIPAELVAGARKVRAFPKLPGTEIAMLGHTQPPVIVPPNSPGECCCWWDGTQWVCPPEPDGP